MAYENMLDSFGVGALGAFFGAFFVVALVVFLAVYIYMAIALMKIAQKTKTENGWMAFVPIANVYLMVKMAGLPGWYTLAVLLPIIPVLGALALAAAFVYFWWKIAEKIGKPGWWGILMIITPVNLVMIGIMAWGK